MSLIDPKNIINKKLVISVGTQTDEKDTNSLDNNNEVDYKIPPPTGRGNYTCRIGDCSEVHGHGRMLPHLRYYHEKDLYEVIF